MWQVMALTLHKYNPGDFTLVQNRFLDDYMMSANGEFVKIYLYLLRCSAAEQELTLSSIADAFNHTENDIKRALVYWEKQHLLHLSYNGDGVLTDIVLTDDAFQSESRQACLNSCAAYESAETGTVPAAPKRISISADRKRELASQEDIRQLIYIAEQYLGKKLSSTEVTNILYFYDELHFSADLIEFLIEYCVSRGKRSISYIRAVALEWAARGVVTVAQAKKDANLFSKDFYAVLHAFGIKDRGPAQAEADIMARWFQELHLSLDLVLEACRRTINRTHAPNFQYADKILENWRENGVTNVSEIAALDRPAPAQPPRKAPAKSKSSNKFNNFPQRKYDYGKLEQQILDC